jgi:hypothetical protein
LSSYYSTKAGHLFWPALLRQVGDHKAINHGEQLQGSFCSPYVGGIWLSPDSVHDVHSIISITHLQLSIPTALRSNMSLPQQTP